MATSTWDNVKGVKSDKGDEGSGDASSTSRAAPWGLSCRNAFTHSYLTETRGRGTRNSVLTVTFSTYRDSVRPDSQQPRWWTKLSQDLNLILVYPHFLLRLPPRGVQNRFMGRVDLSVYET